MLKCEGGKRVILGECISTGTREHRVYTKSSSLLLSLELLSFIFIYGKLLNYDKCVDYS